MDPRKGATVTASDLLEAFAEGSGQPLESAETTMKVFVLFIIDEKVSSIEEYRMHELEGALEVTKVHLKKGPKYGVMMLTAMEEPALVKHARAAISATSG